MKTKKFLSVLLMIMLAVGAFSALPAAAQVKDSSKDVSLTIYALEAADGSEITVDAAVTGEKAILTDQKPISGVSFCLYRVADDETSTAIPTDVEPIKSSKTGEDGAVKIELPASKQGRYLVIENEKPDYADETIIPFLVDLPMTNPDGTGFIYDVYVYPKHLIKELDIPAPKIDKKVSGDDGKTWGDRAYIAAAKGQRAYWKVSTEIPETIDRFTVYEVGDKLDDRLIAPKTSEVIASIDGKDLPLNSYFVSVEGKTISIKFETEALIPYKTKNVDVIFPTAIDLSKPNSVGTMIKNIATLKFSKVTDTGRSGGDTDKDDTDTDTDKVKDTDKDKDTDIESEILTETITSTTVEVITGEIDGFKHDKDNKPLQGAEFVLYSDKECKKEIGKSVSDKDGHFYFRGILSGTYYLKETKAPNGYQLNSNVMEVKIDLSKKESVKVDVENIPVANLPVTGGAGIIGLTIIGFSISLMGIFVIYLALVARRRAKQLAVA